MNIRSRILLSLALVFALAHKAGAEPALKQIGERGLAEVIGLCGYYTMVSMTLNTYEFGLPNGEVSDLLP